MTEVTDVIIARRGGPDRFNTMVAWSLGVHAAVIAFLILGPVDLMPSDEQARTVMTISLAGAPGPEVGMTPMAGRNVPVPTEAAPPRPVPTPATRPVETPAPQPRPEPQPAPPEARPQARTPTRAAAPEEEATPQQGSTRTDTGARGRGFGLATGGGGGGGVQLEVGDFCCPEYLAQMVDLIRRNWNQNQGVAGSTVMRFVISRDGSIENISVNRSSGFQILDLAAQQALLRTRLPQLPAQYPYATLPLNVTFEYQR